MFCDAKFCSQLNVNSSVSELAELAELAEQWFDTSKSSATEAGLIVDTRTHLKQDSTLVNPPLISVYLMLVKYTYTYLYNRL